MARKRAETVPLLVKDVDGVRDGVQDALERGEELSLIHISEPTRPY